jgi:hypothetical protein
MAFVLKKAATYSWPVTIELPVDGGRYEKQTFEGIFNRLKQSRVTQIQVEAMKLKAAIQKDQDISGMVKDQEIADEVLAGWKGILDEDGDELPFSEAVKAELLEIPSVAGSIVMAFGDSISKAKAKN